MTLLDAIPTIDPQRTQIFPFLEDVAGPKTPPFIHTFKSYVYSWNSQTHAGQRYLVCRLLARPLTDFYTGRCKRLLPLITAVRLYAARARAHRPGYVRARSRAVRSERYGGGRSHWLRYRTCAVNFSCWAQNVRTGTMRTAGEGTAGGLLPIYDLRRTAVGYPAVRFTRGSVPLCSLIINWRFELQTDGDWFL